MKEISKMVKYADSEKLFTVMARYMKDPGRVTNGRALECLTSKIGASMKVTSSKVKCMDQAH